MNDTQKYSNIIIQQLQQKEKICFPLSSTSSSVIPRQPKQHPHIKRRNAISIPSHRYNDLMERFNDSFLKQKIYHEQQRQQKHHDDDNKKILMRMKQLVLSAIDELKKISNQLFNAEQKASYWQQKCTELQNQMDELTLLQQNTQLKLENVQRKLLESEHVRLHWNKVPIITYPPPSLSSSTSLSSSQHKFSLKKKSSLTTNISRAFHLSS
ncbi:unnamed protein product [Cunninghamella blakesleeana]